MPKSILIGLDASAGSECATALALEIGQAQGAALTGLAIMDHAGVQPRDTYLHARDVGRLFLERCRRASVDARVLEIVGRPVEAILAEMGHHDLVLLGRDDDFRFQTEGAERGTWESVLHRSFKPTVVVPEARQPISDTVVLACDGSLASMRVLRAFANTGLAREREIYVVTIRAGGSLTWEQVTRAVDTLDGLGFHAHLYNVTSELPVADALLETASKLHAGMIVMSAFGFSRWEEAPRGSVTQHLVERTVVPLFLIR